MALIRGLLALVVAAIIAGASTLWWANAQLEQPLPLSDGAVVVQVESGSTLRVVLQQLAARGLLDHPHLVEWWARYQHLDQRLHVGEYELTAGLTAKGLIEQLSRGDVIRYTVTLPEGITLADAIVRLHAQPTLERLVKSPDDPQVLALVEPDTHAEGWFLPETYQFTRGDSDLDVLKRANQAMRDALKVAWEGRDPDSPLRNPYEVLILASIVERETSVAAERPEIAGVFLRRLEQKMRLQTDPTVIYGLGDRYAGNLTRAHLRDADNRWNTYVISGLPPTPIALPGLAALNAAVHPASGASLYFVARGDGYHAFADTLEEHQANVRRYQLSRRENYRSTPEGGL